MSYVYGKDIYEGDTWEDVMLRFGEYMVQDYGCLPPDAEEGAALWYAATYYDNTCLCVEVKTDGDWFPCEFRTYEGKLTYFDDCVEGIEYRLAECIV